MKKLEHLLGNTAKRFAQTTAFRLSLHFLLYWIIILYSVLLCKDFFYLQSIYALLNHFYNTYCYCCVSLLFLAGHTSAKLIEVQQKCLSHGLHDLGSQMESNDTLHGSELVQHWVLVPKSWKFGPVGPKIFAQKFLYTKLVRYHAVTLWGFKAKIVFGAKQVRHYRFLNVPHQLGKKIILILCH